MYEEMFRKQAEMEQRKQKRKEMKLVKKPSFNMDSELNKNDDLEEDGTWKKQKTEDESDNAVVTDIEQKKEGSEK